MFLDYVVLARYQANNDDFTSIPKSVSTGGMPIVMTQKLPNPPNPPDSANNTGQPGVKTGTGVTSQPATKVVSSTGVNPSVPSLNKKPIVIFDPVQKTIPEIFRAILDIIMVFAIPIILFFIVWAGFLYVKATGNPTKIEAAHKALLYALIGGLIVLGANIILAVITNTINVFVN